MGDRRKSGHATGSDKNVVEFQKTRRGQASALREKEQLIGRQLRQVYEVALNDPVPDHLLDLLKKLDGNDPEK